MYLRWTGNLQVALTAYRDAAKDYVPGRDPSSCIDGHKIAIADALLEALAVAQARVGQLPLHARPIGITPAVPRRRKGAR